MVMAMMMTTTDVNSSFRPYTLGPLCLWQCFMVMMMAMMMTTNGVCVASAGHLLMLTLEGLGRVREAIALQIGHVIT